MSQLRKMLCYEGCGTLVPVADDVVRVRCHKCTLKAVLSFNNRVSAQNAEKVEDDIEDDGSLLTEDAPEDKQSSSNEEDESD